MKIDYFWDRDADLLIYALSDDGAGNDPLIVEFANPSNPHQVWTVSVLGPARSGSAYRMGAVPVAKLGSARCRLILKTLPPDDDSPAIYLGHNEFVLQKARPITSKIAASWQIRVAPGKLTLEGIKAERTRPAPVPPKHPFSGAEDGPMPRVQGPDITRPEDLIGEEVDAIIPLRRNQESLVDCPSLGELPHVFPSTHDPYKQTIPRIAVDVGQGAESNRPVRLKLLEGGTGLDLIVQKLSFDDISATLSLDPLLRDCALIEKVRLDPGQNIELQPDRYHLAPLDRLVIHACDEAEPEPPADAKRTLLLERLFGRRPEPSATPRPKGPAVVDFVFGIGNDRVEDIGPVLALANYVAAFEPDKVLSRMLRADLLHSKGLLPDWSPQDRVWSLPTSCCHDLAGKPEPEEFIRHADRAFDLEFTGATEPMLNDEAAVQRLIDRFRKPGDEQTAMSQEATEWLSALLKAKVPADQLRVILFDRSLRNLVAPFAPQPAPATPETFYADLRRLSEVINLKEDLLSFGLRFGLLSPPTNATAGALQTWLEGVSDADLDRALPMDQILERIGKGLAAAMTSVVLAFANSRPKDDKAFGKVLLRRFEASLTGEELGQVMDPIDGAASAANSFLTDLHECLKSVGEWIDSGPAAVTPQAAWSKLITALSKKGLYQIGDYDDGMITPEKRAGLTHLFKAPAAKDRWSPRAALAIGLLLK